MDVIFPFGFPAPTAFYLVLFAITLSIYMVFMHYVIAGSLVLLGRAIRGIAGLPPRTIVADIVRDWLPAILGLAITTGIAPLLFLQILYKRQFYTANLLLFHRFMLLLPALIVAYYMLYLLKMKRRQLQGAGDLMAASIVCACFAYTASAWTENHLLSLNSAGWEAQYESGRWFYRSWEFAPRLIYWVAASFPTLAIVLAWQIHWGRRMDQAVEITTAARRLRAMALDGLAVAALAAIIWLIFLERPWQSAMISALGMPYLTLATLGVIVQGLAWWKVRTEADLTTSRLLLISAGAGAQIVGTVVVREVRRLQSIDLSSLYETHRQASQVGGMGVFLTFFAINAALIVGCVILVARGLAAKQKQPVG